MSLNVLCASRIPKLERALYSKNVFIPFAEHVWLLLLNTLLQRRYTVLSPVLSIRVPPCCRTQRLGRWWQRRFSELTWPGHWPRLAPVLLTRSTVAVQTVPAGASTNRILESSSVLSATRATASSVKLFTRGSLANNIKTTWQKKKTWTKTRKRHTNTSRSW